MRCLDGIIDSTDMNHHLTTEQQLLREDVFRDKVSLIAWRTVKKKENEIDKDITIGEKNGKIWNNWPKERLWDQAGQGLGT